tara:strand:- start:43 stop:669 length:627 start_codon:yes stop_codon:yes gene_type:complete
MKNIIDLPKKDKDGKSYLSYSQIQLFYRDKEEYYKRYILGEKFEGNAYTDFGSKVGEALEKNDFSKFNEMETGVLKHCERLDEFEKEVRIDFNEFYVLGFIDTNSSDYTRIIDYKTGGNGKDKQYYEPEYKQLCYYALALRQQYGVTPTTAQVNFIRRDGNAFRGEELAVGCESFLIDVDISYNRLKAVYWEILKTAKEIELFYTLRK